MEHGPASGCGVLYSILAVLRGLARIGYSMGAEHSLEACSRRALRGSSDGQDARYAVCPVGPENTLEYEFISSFGGVALIVYPYSTVYPAVL